MTNMVCSLVFGYINSVILMEGTENELETNYSNDSVADFICKFSYALLKFRFPRISYRDI